MNFDAINSDLLALTRSRGAAVDPNLPLLVKLKELLGYPEAVAVLVEVKHRDLTAAGLQPMTALATIADVSIANSEMGLPVGVHIHLVLRLPRVDSGERALVLYEALVPPPLGPPT